MDKGYKIGAVAKLTGISTDSIRAWERRYGVVEPNRGENNNRYYTEEHIGRLISVKRLVDAGQAIGTVCRLSDQELQDRTHGILGSIGQPSVGALKKWTVISVQQPIWLKACVEAQHGIEVRWVRCLEAFSASNEDFVVIDMPSLSEVNEKLVLRMLPDELAPRCLIVYKFASRTQLRALASKGIRLLKGPLEPFALVNLLRVDGQSEVAPLGGVAASSIAQVSKEDDVLCNCKNQLSGLVNALNQLEAYSSGCAKSSQMDDALCQHIVEQTVQARSIMEQSLSNVVEHVGAENRKQTGLIN
jgi:DNA-binding transcriptional MerR regulator|tara:strand:+ start:145 stop:1050 length:906 start_codon:yes stop_codon:yes gene_type:complete